MGETQEELLLEIEETKVTMNMAMLLKGLLRPVLYLLLTIPAILPFAAPVMAIESPDRLVVVVNEQQLRQVHLDRVMNELLPMASFHGGVTVELKAENQDKAIERLIENELLYQEGVRLGLKPDAMAVKDAFRESVKRVGGKKRLNEALVLYGISEDEFSRMLKAPMVTSKVVEQEVDKKAKVAEEDIMAYYEANLESHFNVLKRRFRHIVLKTDPGDPQSWGGVEEKASEILKEINGGADFEEMARSFSEGPRKEKGGDTGDIDRSQILPELSRAGWAMKQGEVSGIIKTIYGFHMLKLEEILPLEAVPFEQAKVQIERFMLIAQKQKLKQALLESLRSKADIEVFID